MRARLSWIGIGLGFVMLWHSTRDASAATTGTQVSKHAPVLAGAAWIENRGQWPEEILFVAQQPGLRLRAERGGLVLEVGDAGKQEGTLVRLRPQGSTSDLEWEALEPLLARHHYFIGDDPSHWVRDARSFGALRWNSPASGVRLSIHGSRGQLAYVLERTNAPSGGEEKVTLEGAAALDRDFTGVLKFEALGRILGLAGVARRDAPPADSHPIGAAPGLTWSTYLGGTAIQGDTPTDVAFDAIGDVFVVGNTFGPEFPQTPGTFQRKGGRDNVFLVKLRGSDGALLFSSLIGGSHGDSSTLQAPVAVAVDSAGNPIVAGWTVASDFPVSPGAYDTQKDVHRTGFVLKLTESGNDVLFSTFLEGKTKSTEMVAIHIGPQDAVVVSGSTQDAEFPTTPGAYQEDFRGGSDSFLASLEASGASLSFSTYLGGSDGELGGGLDLGWDGSWTVGGTTSSEDFPTTPGAWLEEKNSPFSELGFVARLSADASTLLWATYFGSDEFQGHEEIDALAVDALGAVTFEGYTTSNQLPTTPGAIMETLPEPGGQSGFLARFSEDGSTLLYSTYLGTPNSGGTTDVSVDASGFCTVAGSMGPWYPTTPGAYDTDDTDTGLGSDAIVTRISPGGDRFYYSSYLGGQGLEYSVDVAQTLTGRVVLSGLASAPGGFPTTPGAPFPEFQGGQSDAFVTVMDLLLEGVREYGRSTPSCLGPVRIAVTERPTAGAGSFGLYASCAPPDAQGWLLVSTRARNYDDAVSSSAPLLVEPKSLIGRIPVSTDEYGFVETPFPLVGHAAGEELFFQYLFANPPACPGTFAECASAGLAVCVLD